MSERTKTECTHWAKFVSLMKWNTEVAVAVVSQFAQNIFFISQSVANCRTTSITTAAFATTTAAAYLFSHFLKWPNDRTKRNAKKTESDRSYLPYEPQTPTVACHCCVIRSVSSVRPYQTRLRCVRTIHISNRMKHNNRSENSIWTFQHDSAITLFFRFLLLFPWLQASSRHCQAAATEK